MKIVDTKGILRESTLEEEVDSLLEGLGDAAAKPDATSEAKPEEIDVDAAAKAAEEHNECGEEAGEEVKPVEITEETKPVVNAKPELESADKVAGEVEDSLEDDHAAEAEDVEGVVVEGEETKDDGEQELLLEPASEEAGPDGERELEKADTAEEDKPADDEDKPEEEPEKKDEESADEDKPEESSEEEKPAEETEVAIKESFDSLLSLLDILNEEVEALSKKPEPTSDAEPEMVDADAAAKAAEEHNECGEEAGEELEPVEITEGEEPTLEREPELEPADDIADEVEDSLEDDHAATVEDVVGVVVEAARRAKENGGTALQEDIVRELMGLLEEKDPKTVKVLMGVGKKPEDREYDVDAAVQSSQMNGSEEAFDDYAQIQGDGADAALTGQVKPEEIHESADGDAVVKPDATSEAKPEEIDIDAAAKAAEEHNECGEEAGEEVKPVEIKETVAYSSLREACLLDEDYFQTDSYSLDTAESKRVRLTEQVSLLMAREAMDPMYDELLKTSLYAQRLQEALLAKYGDSAAKKVGVIVEREPQEQ